MLLTVTIQATTNVLSLHYAANLSVSVLLKFTFF